MFFFFILERIFQMKIIALGSQLIFQDWPRKTIEKQTMLGVAWLWTPTMTHCFFLFFEFSFWKFRPHILPKLGACCFCRWKHDQWNPEVSTKDLYKKGFAINVICISRFGKHWTEFFPFPLNRMGTGRLSKSRKSFLS